MAFSDIGLEYNKQQILDHLAKARAVCDAAEAKGRGRNLNAAECAEVDKHLDAVKVIKKGLDEAKQRKADGADMARQLGDMCQEIGLDAPDSDSGYGGAGRYTPNGSKSHPGAAKWGQAVVTANSDNFRYKGITAAGTVVVAVPAPAVVEMGRPVPTLRSLIPSEPTQGRFSFHRQTVRTNLAATVAAGARKPTSIYTTELIEDRARVIAHLSEPQSRMDFADAPALQGFVGDEMFYGLERALEDQLLNGNGIGENLTGLNSTVGIQTVAYSSNLVTTTRKAVTALEIVGFQGTGWVLNPSDWETPELSATSTGSLLVTEAGQHAPIDSSARRLWGKPVVASPACPVGVGWYADFSSTKLYVREEARLDWSEHIYREDQFGEGIGGSLFEANELMFRAEGRFGYAVMRPNAVVKIDLTP